MRSFFHEIGEVDLSFYEQASRGDLSLDRAGTTTPTVTPMPTREPEHLLDSVQVAREKKAARRLGDQAAEMRVRCSIHNFSSGHLDVIHHQLGLGVSERIVQNGFEARCSFCQLAIQFRFHGGGVVDADFHGMARVVVV
ncbi:hypothetical protein LMTR3_35825 [Bradyrhizobium sp. LMTR 3]|nr:hypothetical protein LMTR3_35825 [Bradyrhizobium sp. LMTR 3]